MRRHAQELDDDVIWKHVELYVNDWTTDLGREGAVALRELARAAREAQLLPDDAPGLEVFAGAGLQAP
jgi:1,4-dihydroxy-6-naphthoate synthase